MHATTMGELYAATEPLLDAAEAMPVGPALVGRLVELQDEPMGAAGAVRLTALWERCSAWMTAQAMRSVATAVGSSFGPGDAVGRTVTELAVHTHVSEPSMGSRVGLVQQVQSSLPLCWEAMNAGAIALAHVRALARVVAHAEDATARAVEARVLPRAIERGWTPYQVKLSARRALAAIDAAGLEERAAIARSRESQVRFVGLEDQMAVVIATGDAPMLRQVADAIDATAQQRRREGDQRPIGMLRVAALADAVLGPEQAAHPNVEVGVTVDLPTLLGLAERPGELSGYGPITAETARGLAADGTWRRFVTDPVAGGLIDLGRTAYRPSPALRRLVNAQHRTCRFVGCHKPAVSCDLDHITAWDAGGATSEENLHPLCRHHHNLKAERWWRVIRHPDRSETWTSPHRFTYPVPAPTYVEDLVAPREPPEDEVDIPESGAVVEEHDSPPRRWWELVEPPPLTDEELELYADTVDAAPWDDELFERFRAAAERHYDGTMQLLATGAT